MRKRILFIVSAFIVAGAIVSVFTYARFRGDMQAAQERLQAAGGQVIETDCGTIEYAAVGEGPPVLVVHGAGGGFDQGLLLSEAIGDDWRFIVPSRFGYLGTPLRGENSPAAQADAHACLLDSLGIDKVAVVGISAGGPSSLQFALRHPNRTAALVMLSAVSPLPSLPQSTPDAAFRLIFGSDFVYWLLTTVGRGQMTQLFGVTPEVQANLTPQGQAEVDAVLEAMHPVSPRREGILEDMLMDRYLVSGMPLERIVAPTLVVHALDDKLVSYDYGKYSADHIPGAHLVTLESGGHLLAGQREVVRSEVTDFLTEYVTIDLLGWVQ